MDEPAPPRGDVSRGELRVRLRDRIRIVPDFPIPGVMFQDITPVLADGSLFRDVTDALAVGFSSAGVTHVAAIESRGFVFGAPVAQALGVGLVPIRKPGKLPYHTRRVDYALEYGTATLEVHVDAWGRGDRVLVVDDVLATGGTAIAACELIEGAGAEVLGLGFLLSLTSLPGIARLAGRRTEVLLSV